MNNNFWLITLAGVTAAFVAAQPAAAADTASIDVTATVTDNCNITASALQFGDVNTLSGQNVDGSGTINVTCTNQTFWTVSADAGAGADATVGSRKLVNGSNDELIYALYTDEARTNVWGAGVGAEIFDTGNGSPQEKTFYGRINANQTSAPAGNYSDVVSVTVSY